MTIEQAAEVQAVFENLTDWVRARAKERARWIGLNPPIPDDDDSVKVGFGEGVVSVSFFERGGSHDDYDMYTSLNYPAPLIFLDGDELAAWVAGHNAEREMQRRAVADHYATQAEARERAAYLALKAKYG